MFPYNNLSRSFVGNERLVCNPWHCLASTYAIKFLSGNQYLGEDELGASEVHERQVVLGFLLPAHQSSRLERFNQEWVR